MCELTNPTLPDGLIYLENFVDETYAKEISDFIINDGNQGITSILFVNMSHLFNLKKLYQGISDLKNRRVKHYGYEFRYGTNDVDETKPLDAKIPLVCVNLLDKCLNSGLIHTKPDQMTVNFYEPGQGIPPHIDNINAFDDYIMSLSLLSSVVMEFRLKENTSTINSASLCLKPNSLVVLKSDSRYKWSHSIAERKHDLIRLGENSSDITIVKRSLRISLTFRKLIDKASRKSNDVDVKLPFNDEDASKFESSYVHSVYNQIAEHFSNTRHSAWPGVAEFIQSLSKHSLLLDIGCGNGKYLNLRNDIFAVCIPL